MPSPVLLPFGFAADATADVEISDAMAGDVDDELPASSETAVRWTVPASRIQRCSGQQACVRFSIGADGHIPVPVTIG